MSGRTSANTLVVGAESRADLLPPEVRAERRATARRRHLGFSVIGVLVLALLATGGATALALQAQAAMEAERTRTTDLLAEQAKYGEVRTLQNQVDLVLAAQQVGASTEIDWKGYLEDVQGTLPPSVVIKSVEIDSASPMTLYTQATTPLLGDRVATVTFTATSPLLPDVPTWLTGLATLPGYADALPGSVTVDTSGLFTVNITMHVNADAFAKRFTTEGN